ncbi:PAS domain S-box protein [Dehalobacter sp. DCM]|uniref:PAS domain-containing hybrid sensor histidine kinase/response regulator n=1 Tax=Dehalobacter sp. DCM TaxID=2907827 RepID=UPI003081F229|nr:PAS domain S-box protein [Dehalobacter sp. DCM]
MHLEKERLTNLLNYIGDGIISANSDGVIDYMNTSAEKLTGWTLSDALGKTFADVFVLRNLRTMAVVDNPLYQTIREKRQIGLPNYTALFAKDGSVKLISATMSPVRDERNEITGAVVVFRDITRYKQIEEELTIQRNDLRYNFDHTPVAMAIVAEDHRLVYANEAFLHSFEIMAEDLGGWRIGEVISCPRSLKGGCGNAEECPDCQLRQSIISVLENLRPVKDIYREGILHKKGKECYKYLKLNFVPYIDASTTHVLVSIEDITEHKLMEENLVQSRDFYLALFDNLPALIWRSDADGQFNYFNKPWLEFRGKSLKAEIANDWRQDIHPDDIALYRKICRESYATQTAYQIEYRIKRFNGEFRWVIERSNPYDDLEGNFAGYIGACNDITEQKRSTAERIKAEKALRESEDKYRNLFNAADDAIFLIESRKTAAGRTVWFREVNDAACRRLGYTREELLRKGPLDIVPDSQIPLMTEIYMTRKGRRETFETIHLAKDGTEIPVEINSHNVVMQGGTYCLSIARDISERKQIEMQMKKAMEEANAANKAKSEFLANMSHEIRTPLNGVIGMIDLTMMTDLTEEQRDNLVTAETCADSLLKIINDILDFSKIEAGKMTIENKDFELLQLMEKIVKIHYHRAVEKGLTFHCRLPDEMPVIKGDPGRLQQVLNNILGNAVKFTEKGSVGITLTVQEPEKDRIKLQFCITDTGIGIADEERSRLFQSFSQVDGSYSRKYGGTGLGLVISKQLVEMMGGTIQVQSEKGKGSTFSIELTFPTSSREKEFHSAPDQEQLIDVTKHHARVLLAEDDIINQIVVSRMLKEMGYAYSVANNGIEAIRMLDKKDYDLCLMDIQMPIMDGIQAMTMIRKSEEITGHHLPIIALTAHALLNDRKKFVSLGMDDYLAKPFRMTDLYDLIEKLLSKYGKVPDDAGDIRTAPSLWGKTRQISDTLEGELAFVKSEIAETIETLLAINPLKEQLEAEKLAHKVKELSAMIDADTLKNLAFRVELALRRSDYNVVPELVNEMSTLFQCLTGEGEFLKERVN